MPTNYTGNPTATQAPASAPGPGTAPVVVIPNDGETANAASITQDFKVNADYLAWLTQVVANTRTVAGVVADGVGGVSISAVPGSLIGTGGVNIEWCPASAFQPQTGSWTFGGALWTANANAITLSAGLPAMRYAGASASYITIITKVEAKVHPGGASAMQLSVLQEAGMNSTNTPASSSLGSASSSGTGYQILTVSGLSAQVNTDQVFSCSILSGQTNDQVYGVRVTYSNVVA